ncbi:ABC transporter ATP-binding protein, partial [Staphylococcus capitis]|uniref:ABC transporter ATP-binding protein n=1 Tax=Staphylococcus capitis TaxID=29388 RepID=UPI000D1A2D00
MNEIIKVKDLTINFKNFTALKDITFNLYNTNGVIGLIGPNGAGKTTLINTILGQLKPSKGFVKAKRSEIAYCPDVPTFEPFLTPKEILKQTIQLNGENVKNFDEKINEILISVDLKKHETKLAGGFSRGMKQRLGIAAALILNPKIIFLDEPTSALDPFGQQDILELVKKISSERTIVISSHNLNDIEKVANELIVMNKGELIYNGFLNEFIKKDEEYIYISLKDEKILGKVLIDIKNNQINYSLTKDK